MTPVPLLTSASPRPGELFTDPAAQAVWAGVLTLDVALQHEFLARLRERLAVPAITGGTHTVRISRLVAAVREAESILLTQTTDVDTSSTDSLEPSAPPALTEDTYEGLRRVHREFGWPPASSMRNWVQGGWNDVLDRAMVKTVDTGDALLVRSSAEFSWDEVAGALIEYRDHLQEKGHSDPSGFGFHAYLGWAKLPSVLKRPGHRPRSQSPFDKFGGFLTAKAAALAGDPAPNAAGAGPGSVRGRRAARSGHLRPATGYGYTDTELKAAVDEVIAHRNGCVPRAGEYKTARQAIIDAERERGLPERAFPSYNVLQHRWKPWDAVLVACGYPPFAEIVIDPETERGAYTGPRPHISDSQLLSGVREAFEQRGKPFTHTVYTDYVTSRDKIALNGNRLATYSCIYQRYRHIAGKRGPFKYVCDRALPHGWDRADE